MSVKDLLMKILLAGLLADINSKQYNKQNLQLSTKVQNVKYQL